MNTYTPEQITEIKDQIVEELGLLRTPVHLTPAQASIILGTSINTLSVWRSTGRYNLAYVKISRRIAYPLTSVAKFILRRTINHTSDAITE